MKKTLAGLLIVGSLAVSAALTAAEADVMRIAVLTAANQADYDANVAMTSMFADLYKKGGATAVYVGQDAVHLTWAVFSVLPSEADIAKVTGSPEWKAAVAKLKFNAINVEVFELGH